MYGRKTVVAIAAVGALSLTAPLSAQRPGPAGGRGAPGGALGGSVAQQFLAHTGDLNLTDQQVVRLAAIARRDYAQGRAARAAIDSARALHLRQPRDSMRPPAMPFDSAAFARARGERQTSLRDALAVLTPDQQAIAWQTITTNRGRGRGPGRAMRGGVPGGRGMFGGARGRRPMMGPDSVGPRGRRGGPPQDLAPNRRPPE